MKRVLGKYNPKCGSSNRNERVPLKAFEGERIAKRLARVGICSRRDAERLILAGRVMVDDKILTSPAFNVTDANRISVDGSLIEAAEETRVWRYHKPAGTITAARDPQGRPTVFEKMLPDMPRVVSVGRLDFNTEGLLLLTNNGELARYMELPKNAWRRYYRVRVHGDINPSKLAALAKGVTISGVHYEPVKVEIERDKKEGTNKWLLVTIHEGKNREVRKIMAHLDLQVTRLIRVAFGPFLLDKLARGDIEEIPQCILHDLLRNFFAVREMGK